MNRFCIKVAGASGGGLLSTGEIIVNALKNMGFYVVADREYPSLITGGHACFTINISDAPIHSLREKADVLMAMDNFSINAYTDSLKDDGVLVHGSGRIISAKESLAKAEEREIKIVSDDARVIAQKEGGSSLMKNVVLIGMLWKTLGFDYRFIEDEVNRKFASKPKLLEIDLRCLKKGFEAVETIGDPSIPDSNELDRSPQKIMLDGNKALALGAIHAGCRIYYAYPMSPASSVLTYMATFANETKMLVKQVEDEISVVNMTLGSMFMGTRALCATSGGGYDLMTETVSLAGMIENPLVVIVAQRPGPATGLPTWTAQGDLNLAVHSAHGEFPRIVIGVSGPQDSFELIQHAFNLAEKYQTPVIVLTEKVIAESKWTVPPFDQNTVKIERGLVEGKDLENLSNEDRYKITEDGLSKRWLPGSSSAFYHANSDEHLEDGSLTEDGELTGKMIAKRMKKMKLIDAALPDPEIYGDPEGADISFVGWGSTKNTALDIIEIYSKKGIKVNYLHYSYLYPLKTAAAETFFEKNGNVFLAEGNYQGQLGVMLEAAGLKFKDKLLKYNGRPFFLEDFENFINENL